MNVVTLPRSAEKNPLSYAKKARAAGADILEIRGDLTPDVPVFQSPLPLLISPRGSGDRLFRSLEPVYIDLELSETALIASIPKGAHLILSTHDYEKTPDSNFLENIVQKMCSFNPWMVKIATKINTYSDFLVHREIKEILNKKSVRSTVLGMGDRAHLSRILSPMQNAFTYACVDSSDASAPGQLSLTEYARMSHIKNPIVCGLLGGSQISASFSPLLHSVCAQIAKSDLVYSLFPTDDLTEAFAALTEIGVTGFSVTAPWKREILNHVTSIDPLVSRLGSANTVLVQGGERTAYNTDVEGFVLGYPFLKNSRNVAILGSGGVVPAVVLALRELNPNVAITIFARSPESSEMLSKCDCTILPLSEVPLSSADTFISAISEDISISLPFSTQSSLTTNHSYAIDLRYGKETKFLIDAKKKGYKTQDGLPMLIAQGIRQFKLFSGNEDTIDFAPVLHSVLTV